MRDTALGCVIQNLDITENQTKALGRGSSSRLLQGGRVGNFLRHAGGSRNNARGGIFKDVRFYPMMNVGHVWLPPPIFSMFSPHCEFGPFSSLTQGIRLRPIRLRVKFHDFGLLPQAHKMCLTADKVGSAQKRPTFTMT